MKPFEIITEEIMNKIVSDVMRNRRVDLIRSEANKLIQENGQSSYTDFSTWGDRQLLTNRPDGDTTHEALVFTRPIEAVEPECSHDKTLRILNWEPKYCADCGAKIGGSDE